MVISPNRLDPFISFYNTKNRALQINFYRFINHILNSTILLLLFISGASS